MSESTSPDEDQMKIWISRPNDGCAKRNCGYRPGVERVGDVREGAKRPKGLVDERNVGTRG